MDISSFDTQLDPWVGYVLPADSNVYARVLSENPRARRLVAEGGEETRAHAHVQMPAGLNK
jgi:hypothetical protein